VSAEPTASQLLPIDELNRVSREAFARALRPLFEAAAPLADALLAGRPYRSYEELLERAATAAARLPEEQKIEVLNAHPRIGDDAETVRRASSLSYREQGYDREGILEPDELARLHRELGELNRAYEGRFGFRFVVFVDRRPKAAIIPVLRERLGRTCAEELETALREMLAIARDRLGRLSPG
jgi:2-oxo-4-hydroxy-4-carboxy--5-ureidoimidazoline (OHCU) decarboxylase